MDDFKPYDKFLAKRNTHKYVGTWQHEDDWTEMGSMRVMQQGSVLTNDEDMCEPTRTMILLVLSEDTENFTPDLIKRALCDTFTTIGCSHDYDCCGCRSTYVSSVTCVNPEERQWVVITHSSRNY